MFGISFGELLLVSIVLVIILGPQRLPGAVRFAGLWIGRLKRSFNSVKNEIEKELGADEIRRQLHNEYIMKVEEETKNIMKPIIETKKDLDGLESGSLVENSQIKNTQKKDVENNLNKSNLEATKKEEI